MLVYGDHSEFADPRQRLSEIGEQLSRAALLAAGIERHAELVGALIEAGKLQQGIEDAGEPGREIAAFAHVLAAAVVRSWDSGLADVGELPPAPDLDWRGNVELRLPEGFAFYALYPEAYIDAARRLRLAGPPRVIGIRSIGTTLGAIVAAALGAPPAITVRPFGDPFAREVELPSALVAQDAHYVIVDEGPGLSGSSFGAVADWLEARGVPLGRIAFLPSHDGEPGPEASEAHRRRWAHAQRVPAGFGDRLPQLLQAWIASEIGKVEALVREISGGGWRHLHYASEACWPPAIPGWERRKFLVRTSDGPLLAKFAGLGGIGARKLEIARGLHSAGLTPEPIGLVHGFLLERWQQEARPLTPDERPVEDIAAYIAARAQLLAAAEGSGAPLDLLLQMSRRNVSLALGDEMAARLDCWTARLPRLEAAVIPVRTDNKLDAHEWLRAPDGRLLKTDALDHHCGHDLIGCQDAAWDVAGAITEFDLRPFEADALVAAVEQATGRTVNRGLLDFYLIAYSAFRLGQAALGAQSTGSDQSERRRLTSAGARFAARLRSLLHNMTACRTGANPWSIKHRNETDAGTNPIYFG